jgi:glycine oxidase
MQHTIVVGAGVLGCMCASHFAEQGVKVSLIDCADPLSQVSSAGFGSLTPYSDPFFTGEMSKLAARGVELHRHWMKVIGSSTSLPLDSGPTGLIQLFDDVQEASAKCKKVIEACETTEACSLISVEQALSLEPRLNQSFSAALMYNEPWIDLDLLRTALSKYVESHPNITLIKDTCSGIDQQASSVTVKLAVSGSIAGDIAIVCTGLTSPSGVLDKGKFEIIGVRGDVVLVQSPPGTLMHHVYKGDAFLTPRKDGRILVGSTYHQQEPHEYASLLTTEIEAFDRAELMHGLMELVSGSDSFTMNKEWRNWRPKLRGRGPLIGPTQPRGQILLAMGMLGLGVTLAPAIAEVLFDYANGNSDRIPNSCRAY